MLRCIINGIHAEICDTNLNLFSVQVHHGCDISTNELRGAGNLADNAWPILRECGARQVLQSAVFILSVPECTHLPYKSSHTGTTTPGGSKTTGICPAAWDLSSLEDMILRLYLHF